MRAEIVPADPLHVRELCATMRAREYEAFGQLAGDPEELIAAEVNSSFSAWAGVVDGEVIALGGVKCRDILSNEAYVWMVCGEGCERAPVAFIRGTLRAFKLAKANFSTIYGYVMADFGASVRWLKWMGFTVEPEEHGVCLFWHGQRPRI